MLVIVEFISILHDFFYRENLINDKKVDTLSYKTTSANSKTVNKDWFIVDATDMILGRLATEVAHILRGKHKTSFTPHVDCGDNVIVINSNKVKLSGAKMTDKVYLRHSGYPGGQKSLTATELNEKKPLALVETAVKGMLPKNKLGRQIYKNLYVYEGAEHNQNAQKPKTLNIK